MRLNTTMQVLRRHQVASANVRKNFQSWWSCDPCLDRMTPPSDNTCFWWIDIWSLVATWFSWPMTILLFKWHLLSYLSSTYHAGLIYFEMNIIYQVEDIIYWVLLLLLLLRYFVINMCYICQTVLFYILTMAI